MEQEFKPGTPEGIIPIGVQYQVCLFCNGKGSSIFNYIKRPCLYCRGAGKLPLTNNEGNWQKKGEL